MARTTRDGEVYLTGFSLDGDEALEGTVSKLEDGRWRSVCALDEEDSFITATKKEAVQQLDEHFLAAHTTLTR
jgi:hypothetical protein